MTQSRLPENPADPDRFAAKVAREWQRGDIGGCGLSGRIAQPNREPRRDARDDTARCKRPPIPSCGERRDPIRRPSSPSERCHYDHERQPRSPKHRLPGSSLTPEYLLRSHAWPSWPSLKRLAKGSPTARAGPTATPIRCLFSLSSRFQMPDEILRKDGRSTVIAAGQDRWRHASFRARLRARRLRHRSREPCPPDRPQQMRLWPLQRQSRKRIANPHCLDRL